MTEIAEPDQAMGIRTAILRSYDIARFFYGYTDGCAVKKLSNLGCLIRYSLEIGYMGRSRRTPMDVNKTVANWKKMVVGLAIAHDKDEADRYEAAIDACLIPILNAPIKQIREFYPKLLQALKDDRRVPFLVWRSYEVWVENVLSKATDESFKVLKVELAKEIADLVEQDVKDQIPEQLMRALMWRNPERLEEVKAAVIETKAKGEPVRLRGRESCLFLEAGGTPDQPKVCIQI